jgi:hypothetical protein
VVITAASPKLTSSSWAICGISGSATRMVATEAKAAALRTTIGRTIEGPRIGSPEAAHAGGGLQ